ncbi:MAG: alternative ribosome rescue aminoacyl-tRNA hydrolase ArfB [Hyphomicrobiaceae bacterium]|jgi:ribosome-associated protein
MLKVTSRITIADEELEERFVRASGPGGQNVNKVSTAVELRFNARASPALTEDVRKSLIRLAGRRMTDEGVLVIRAERFRTQERNREDARQRLVDLIAQAAVPPKPRVKTKPTLASKNRRLDSKSRRSEVKRNRAVRSFD